MVNRLIRRIRRSPAVESVLTRVVGQFTTWPADDFGRFVSASIGTGMAGAIAAMPPPIEPLRPPPPTSTAPATFEMRFMRLHAEGKFDEMWDMLAEDAQRAWGGRDAFIREMPRLGDDVELLDMQVVNVKVLEGWSCVIEFGSSGESGHSTGRCTSCLPPAGGEHCATRQGQELR
jgi:hypothetical protein